MAGDVAWRGGMAGEAWELYPVQQQMAALALAVPLALVQCPSPSHSSAPCSRTVVPLALAQCPSPLTKLF